MVVPAIFVSTMSFFVVWLPLCHFLWFFQALPFCGFICHFLWLPLYRFLWSAFADPFLFIYNKKSLLAYNSIIPNTT